MAEFTAARNNALPYPVYGLPYVISFPLLDADGDPVSPSAPDSEISKNGDTFADCTNEAVEIATSSGICYLSLTGTELTTDLATIRVQSTGAKTTVLALYPRKLVSIRAGTSASGGVSTSTIVLDASASAIDDFYNGMIVAAVIDGTTEVRMITDYTGSNQTATVTPDWNTAPDNNDTFTIYRPDGVQVQQSNATHIGGTSQTGLDLGANWTAARAAKVDNLDATISSRSTLTQTQVTGGAYALNSSSFAFNAALDFTTAQKAATIARVTLTDTVTTYTGNTPQTGDSYARIGATGSGLTSLAPSSTALSTATWTGTRAGYLDNLSGGAVATAAQVSGLAVNTRCNLNIPVEIETPDAATQTYKIRLHLYDVEGNMEAPDSTPTVSLTNAAGTDRSSRLSVASNPSTGVYTWDYTATAGDAEEQLVWIFTVVEGGLTRTYPATSYVVEETAYRFSSTDRANLTAVKAKTDNLPSDPADASDIAASFTIVNNTLATMSGYIDTEVAAIKAKTDNLPPDPADASDIAASFNTVLTYLSNISSAVVAASNGAVADTGATTTVFKTNISKANDFYNDALIVFTSGALTGQSRPIADFAQTNGVITVDEPFTSAPANGDTFTIQVTHVHPVSQIQSGLATLAAVGSPMQAGSTVVLTDGSITEAKFTTPAETAGRPTGILGMIRRLFEGRHNKRTRNRTTGVVTIRNAADTGDLETATQSTSGVTDTMTGGA